MPSANVRTVHIPFQIPIAPDKALERYTYSYLILGDTLAIVDCGVAGSWHLIEQAIRNSGFSPHDVSHILITHSHPDHIGGLATARERTGALVAAPAKEREWIEHVDSQYRARQVPGFYELVQSSVTVDISMEEGDTISLGDVEIHALNAPGHCAGQMAFHVTPENGLISGDAVPRPGVPPIYEDARATRDTILRFMELDNLSSLYSSWDVPRFGPDVYTALRQGLEVVDNLHTLVCKVFKQFGTDNVENIAGAVFATLGMLPMPLAPPLMATIRSHMDACTLER